MAVKLEITIETGQGYDDFDAELFRKAYWDFIRYTTLRERQAAQALAALLEMRETDQHRLNKALRPWFADTVEGGFWRDPDFKLERNTKRGVKPATRIQEIDFLVSAIISKYAFLKRFEYRLKMFQKAGVKPIAAIDARFGCKLHSPDSWEVVDPIIYMQTNPMHEALDCRCSFSWSPASTYKGLYDKWEKRIQKHRSECQNPR